MERYNDFEVNFYDSFCAYGFSSYWWCSLITPKFAPHWSLRGFMEHLAGRISYILRKLRTLLLRSASPGTTRGATLNTITGYPLAVKVMVVKLWCDAHGLKFYVRYELAWSFILTFSCFRVENDYFYDMCWTLAVSCFWLFVLVSIEIAYD